MTRVRASIRGLTLARAAARALALLALAACGTAGAPAAERAEGARVRAVLGDVALGPWKESARLERGLPAGVAVLTIEDAAAPLHAWCVAVDLQRSGLEVRVLTAATASPTQRGRGGEADGAASAPPALATVSAIAAASGAPVAVNAGYFGGARSLSLAIDQGRALSLPPSALTRDGASYAAARGAFGVRRDGTLDVAWVHAQGGEPRALAAPPANRPGAPIAPDALRDQGEPWPVTTAVGAGPVLVQDGAPRVTWTEEVFFGSGIGAPDERQPRTAVGITRAGRLLLVVVQGRARESRGETLDGLARLLVGLGAVEALNLDGGGSSALALRGERASGLSDGQEERAVATVLALLPAGDERGKARGK